MKDKYFIDTNIFIYSFDNSARKKQIRSQQIITEAISSGKGIISYQVMQEFLNVSQNKFTIPMDILDAKQYLEKILTPLCEVHSDSELMQVALDIKKETQFSFYDSLVVAAAIRSKCGILYTEDLQDNRTIGKLTIVNPFRF